MAIRLLDDKTQWDKFIDDSSQGLLYHKWDFLKLIEKYTGYKLLPYGIYKGNSPICLFPLYYKNIYGLISFFSPPPGSGVPYLGPVMHQAFFNNKQRTRESNLQLVAEELDKELERFSPNYISAILTPGFTDIRFFKELKYDTIPNFTYTIDLEKSLEEIWTGFFSNCRNNIRKNQCLGLELESSTEPLPMVEFLKERYQAQGMNFLISPEYLGELLGHYPENISLYYFRDNNQTITATMNHQYNQRFILWFGIPKPRDSKYTNANEQIVWDLIRLKKEEGYTTFEICGANKPQLCRFRNKYNPELVTWYHIRKTDLVGKIGEQAYQRFVKKNKSRECNDNER